MEHFIGIDVSKATLDLALINARGQKLALVQIENSTKGLGRAWRRWFKEFDLVKDDCLVCLEPTAQYSDQPLIALVELEIPTWLANASDMLRSLGMRRGKNDQLDAQRIADYARRFHDKARLFTKDHLRLRPLKKLLSRRRLLVDRRKTHQVLLKDYNPLMPVELRRTLDRLDKAMLRAHDKAITEVEAMILVEIKRNPDLQRQYELILSVESVGPVLAAHLLALTDGFARFASARQLACHAGVAPYEYRSGSSIRGKTRVSSFAHRQLKTLLHMSAVSSISRPGELRAFYDRKLAEGKAAMTVLNAIRNKIIHRVYAVLERGTPYMKKTFANAIE
jgi:transposase